MSFGAAGSVLAALLFAGLAAWQLRRVRDSGTQALLVLGLAGTALWALTGATEGPLALVTRLAGTGRDVGWLGFVLTLLLAARTERATQGALVALHAVLAAVLAGQTAFDLLPALLHLGLRGDAACAFVALLLRMVFAVGGLVLVHNLYTAAAPDARWTIRLPMGALAILWAYDLHCWTVAWLLGGWPMPVVAWRGWVAAATAPLFAIALWRHAGFRMRLSRAATFRSLSLLAILFYLALLLVVARTTQMLGGDGGWLAGAMLAAAALAGLALLLPRRLRAWTRVTLLKHLFQHRYDYRAEWLRFTETLGREDAGAPLDLRVVKALADMVEAPGGLLLLPAEDDALTPGARWNWPAVAPPTRAAAPDLACYLAETGRILELDRLRDGEAALLPGWLAGERSAWIVVPLPHFGRLAGAVLLARPAADRALDWEDFDLLRVAGRQAASYLAEARGQEALAQAARFDEFNRRFAFIIHDIRNLVSQLSLVARNAGRHADNPEFRADMIATLQDAVCRMNGLLARLTPHGPAPRPAEPCAVPLRALAERLAGARRRQHEVIVSGGEAIALADPAPLEQALAHLLQNAIEASPAGRPVHLRLSATPDAAVIDVADGGPGMSAEFVRTRLFAPFASTKPAGFGIGAYEARTLVHAIGGRLEVESIPGAGTRFRILLPPAPVARARQPA